MVVAYTSTKKVAIGCLTIHNLNGEISVRAALLSLPSHDEYFLSTEQSSGSTRIAVGDNSPISEGRLASNLASRVMSPGKHPPEGAQNGTLTPAIGRAAAPHGAHALNKTPHDSEEQIQAQDPPNHPPHHVTSSLSRGSPQY